MIVAKLQDATLSKEEFRVLPHLDRRLFESTAKDRFSSLDTHLNLNHPDFDLRLEVNAHLRDAVDSYVEENRVYLEGQEEIKVIELGASLGAISSLFVLDGLHRAGLSNKVSLTLLDICGKPLERTRHLDFDLQGVHKKAGFDIPLETLKRILQNATILEGNALGTQEPDKKYTVSLAPFTHHHLNIFDKKIACTELERITAENGGIFVGDLTFSYPDFVRWLKKHQTERNSQGQRVPYAVESFVSLEQHQDFFRDSSVLFNQKYPKHYVFAMKRGGKNV